MLWPKKENCSAVQIENYLNLHKFVNSSKWIFNFHTGPCSCAGPGQFHLNKIHTTWPLLCPPPCAYTFCLMFNIVFIPELSTTPFARMPLCGYPHVKVSIRDLSQISATSPIFQQYNYFRQNSEENVTFTFYFSSFT